MSVGVDNHQIDNKNDNRHHHHILDNKSQHQVHYLKGQETMSNTSLQDALMAPEDPEPTPNLFDDYEYCNLKSCMRYEALTAVADKEKKKRIDSDDVYNRVLFMIMFSMTMMSA